MLTTRACFETLKGFEEQFPLVGNDTDYCLRAWQQGIPVVLEPGARLIHHEGISRTGMSETKDVELFWTRWGKLLERGDFFTNPNLDSRRDDWTVNPGIDKVFGVRSKVLGSEAVG
jgi:hypothetical protein